MKLLYTKRSPYARKVRVVALEKQIPLDLLEEDLTNKSPRLLEANPLGKIPALILENTETLVDSPVICEYLDGLKDKPRLIPLNQKERFKVLHYQALADGLMDVTVTCYMEKIRHPQNFQESFIKSQEATIKRTLLYLGENLKNFDKLNLASIAIAAALGYIGFRLPQLGPTSNSNLHQWFLKFSNRPSMEATRPS